MGRQPNTSGRDHWLTIMTVAVFVMAAAGAGFALHTLLPAFLNEPDAKYSLLRFAAMLVAAVFVVGLAARLRRR
jgi:hypothetical protein